MCLGLRNRGCTVSPLCDHSSPLTLWNSTCLGMTRKPPTSNKVFDSAPTSGDRIIKLGVFRFQALPVLNAQPWPQFLSCGHHILYFPSPKMNSGFPRSCKLRNDEAVFIWSHSSSYKEYLEMQQALFHSPLPHTHQNGYLGSINTHVVFAIAINHCHRKCVT